MPDYALPNDISGLIPSHITSEEQLNEWEAENILQASRKYLGKRSKFNINSQWFKKVHHDMFNETWEWAGKTRIINLNIGKDWKHINTELKKLADDIVFWGESGMNLLEQSIRMHHRLVNIHPFLNGNGRHARLVSDIFLFINSHMPPQWPDKKLIDKTRIREHYINTLQKADKGDYGPLVKFTKSLLP